MVRVAELDAQPDLIAFAKGVNSGYVPLGGVVISSDIAHAYDTRVYPGGLTYSGHPLACSTAVASIGIFEEEDVLAHARHLGDDIIGPALRDIAAATPVGRRGPRVGRVLGGRSQSQIRRPASRLRPRRSGPWLPNASATVCGRSAANRIHVVPPCNTPDDLTMDGLAILDAALAVADAAVG